MSADSMISVVASGPVPTTPTDLFSAEMDRLGYGWERIDDNIKSKPNQDLHDLNHPFKSMDVGPRQPGQPQEYYCWTHSRFKEVLISRPHLSTLRLITELTYCLIFCNNGLEIAGYYDSEETKGKLEKLAGTHPWTIIFQNRVPGGQHARFNQDRPHEILFDFDIIDRAAKAGYVAQQDPSYENNMIYTRHIFMISVILGRIFFRSLTDILRGQLTWATRAGGVMNEPRDWEKLLLGGHLVGCSTVDSTIPILDSLFVQEVHARDDGFKYHFQARDDEIYDIVHRIGSWDLFLPLRYAEKDLTRGYPANMTFKMQGIDRAGATLGFSQGYITRIIPAPIPAPLPAPARALDIDLKATDIADLIRSGQVDLGRDPSSPESVFSDTSF